MFLCVKQFNTVPRSSLKKDREDEYVCLVKYKAILLYIDS